MGNIHCNENRWSMVSMAGNSSSIMYRLILGGSFFGADIFSFITLKICPSYSWHENVTLKININSSRVDMSFGKSSALCKKM